MNSSSSSSLAVGTVHAPTFSRYEYTMALLIYANKEKDVR